jgi:putative sterol carrier protein
MPTIEETFDALKNRFIAEKAAGTDAVIQWEINGDGGGIWYAVIKDSTCTINPGPASNPDLTLQLSVQDWLDMNAGKKTRQMLFMTGKLKLKGEMGLALKLGSLFPSPKG